MSEESFEAEWNLFEQTFNSVHEQIQSKIAAAAKLLDEATDLADKHGVPFRPNVGTPFRMSYIPDSFKEKFPDVADGSDWCDFTGAHGDTYYGGWQSSQTC